MVLAIGGMTAVVAGLIVLAALRALRRRSENARRHDARMDELQAAENCRPYVHIDVWHSQRIDKP
jgi:hypothetical protein